MLILKYNLSCYALNLQFKATFSTSFDFKSTQLNIPYRSSTDWNLQLSYFL